MDGGGEPRAANVKFHPVVSHASSHMQRSGDSSRYMGRNFHLVIYRYMWLRVRLACS